MGSIITGPARHSKCCSQAQAIFSIASLPRYLEPQKYQELQTDKAINSKPFSSSITSGLTMLSSSINIHKPFFLSNPIDKQFSYFPSKITLKPFTVSASLRPPPPANQQLYQPFRPPPSPIPAKYRSLDAPARLEVLENRLGLWYEYAPLIPSLIQEGFSPPSIEEITGISGVEQNRLVVAAQVRETLVQANTDPEVIASFDQGGSELLYEIRLLTGTQRVEAVRYIVKNKLDGKGAQDLARAMKDFPRRRGEKAWESFDYARPGDCLSFLYYRQAREFKNPSTERTDGLEKALEVAESEKAKLAVSKELDGEKEGGEVNGGDELDAVKVPVVRMRYGEVAEATSVVVLPVCKAEEKEKIFEAPWACRTEGEFGVVVAEKAWDRWVVLPSWEPVTGMGNGGVVVGFADARALPWKVNRWYKEEPIMVVANRGLKEVNTNDGFYLVSLDGIGNGQDGELKVERGSALKEMGVEESIGMVVLVVRPPREDTDAQFAEEDWE